MNDDQKLIRTARIAGFWYLMLGISGMVGFLMLHSKIFVDDPAQTLGNLTDHETLARTRLLFEFLIIVSQALAAVWFYKLFKDIDNTAAWALAAWGTVNAVAILVSAMAMAGAITVANGASATNEKLIMVQIFDQFVRHAWGVGNLFFGLWLIPMGYIVVRSRCMPAWLGRVLILGGVGYVLNPFIGYMGVTSEWLGLFVLPATVGEFWMIGYLLMFGIRPEMGFRKESRAIVGQGEDG